MNILGLLASAVLTKERSTQRDSREFLSLAQKLQDRLLCLIKSAIGFYCPISLY